MLLYTNEGEKFMEKGERIQVTDFCESGELDFQRKYFTKKGFRWHEKEEDFLESLLRNAPPGLVALFRWEGDIFQEQKGWQK